MNLRIPCLAGLVMLTLAPRVDAVQERGAPRSAKVDGIVNVVGGTAPVDGVLVTFVPESGPPQKTLTDNLGKFNFDALPPGRYTVTLGRKGFSEPRRSGGPRHLNLEPGAELKNLRLQLTPDSAISGHLVDQKGQPVGSAVVVALRPEYLSGRRVLIPGGLISKKLYLPMGAAEDNPDAPRAKTNERGEYRLFGLEPGQYYVAAWSTDAQDAFSGRPSVRALPPVYYPNATDPAAAVPVTVQAGADIPSINIEIPAAELYTAQFKVIPPTLPPLPPSARPDCSASSYHPIQAFVLVRHSQNLDVIQLSTFGYESNVGLQSTGGNAWITPKLFPGSYEIYHSSCVDEFLGIAGRLSFDIVDRDIDAGVLTIPTNAAIRGRVQSGPGVQVAFERLTVRLRPFDLRGVSPSLAPNPTPEAYLKVAPDGGFAFERTRGDSKYGKVSPGRYHVDVGGLPPDVYIGSIRFGAAEVRDSGIVVDSERADQLLITLESPGAIVAGVVRDARDEPVGDSRVVLVPQSRADGRVDVLKVANADQQGVFSIRGVPPGEYTAFAWDYVQEGAYESVEFLESFRSQGAKISVDTASAASLTLRVIRTTD